MANNDAPQAFDCIDDATVDDKPSVTATQDSEIARIWKTFDDIGSAYNNLEDNVYKIAQARPIETKSQLAALEQRFLSHAKASEKHVSELKAANLDLEQRLVDAEQCNKRIMQRLNDLEILFQKSVLRPQSLKITASEHERLGAYSPEYAPSKSESDANMLRKSSSREHFSSVQEQPTHDQSSLSKQTAITPDSTMIDDRSYGSDFSPMRRGDRSRKPVERENFESWKGKRLAGSPRKH